MIRKLFAVVIIEIALLGSMLTHAANDVPTQFPNAPGVINTRHNMSQSTELSNSGGASMNNFRNRYGEVCVYCHTPHGGVSSSNAPLWNRQLPSGATFTTYVGLTQTVAQPGAASLACLSCHDGSQASDAIFNMPGSGNYSSTASPWTYVPTGSGTFKSLQHRGLNSNFGSTGTPSSTSCLTCHNPDGGSGNVGDPTDFTVFLIGKDLRDDHPVGVLFPTVNGPATDWKTPNGSVAMATTSTKFFDENGNGRMDKNEIRMYDTGGGAMVECGSCHDPHGIFGVSTFLRKANVASAVCMTCHNK